jgi:uncharacterized protein (TIGR03435 family)
LRFLAASAIDSTHVVSGENILANSIGKKQGLPPFQWTTGPVMPMYALVVAKNGPKFKDVSTQDNSNDTARRPGAVVVRRGLLMAQEIPVAGLLNSLSNILGRSVVDRTGLIGKYDLKVEWRPDEMQVSMFSAMGVPEGFGAPPPDWQGPTLFTALEEQLGLQLSSQRGPVETLVVERIERPSEN